MKRADAETTVISLGGEIASGVSKNLNYLVVGNNQIVFPNTVAQFSGYDPLFLQTNMQNFNANGSGGVWQNSGYAFLFLGATYGSIIENIFLTNFDTGIRMEFCMNATVTNIFTNNTTSYSVWVKTGSWTGAALANASSNMVEISHIRVFDTNNQIAGVALLDSDTSVISQIIVEGTGTPQYGVLWDSLNSTVAPNGIVKDCHIETICTKSAVYVKPRSGKIGRAHV